MATYTLWALVVLLNSSAVLRPWCQDQRRLHLSTGTCRRNAKLFAASARGSFRGYGLASLAINVMDHSRLEVRTIEAGQRLSANLVLQRWLA